jgi:magnesium transporter
MALLSGDQPVFSSSPIALRGDSPIRRRRSISPDDLAELASRPRHSPTLSRSYDPDEQERQRTMDVDMALQLSRARRETVSINPSLPSTQDVQQPTIIRSFPMLSPLSSDEQRAISFARGETPHPDDEAILLPHRQPSPPAFILHHLDQVHDSSLLAPMGRTAEAQDHDDRIAPMYGLPTYQTDLSRSHFDFAPMEEFASAEKAALGLSSPTVRFPGDASRRHTDSTQSPHPPSELQAALDEAAVAVPRRARQRKFSQSISSSRLHRKGIGGKMALFENNAGAPPPTLPGRFGFSIPSPNLSTIPPSPTSFPVSGTSAADRPAISPLDLGSAQLPPRTSGILNTGHDRPYRFSFYSNALSATIHARSLSELPAEDQSFEDLFTGVSPTADNERRGVRPMSGEHPIAAPVPISAVHGLNGASHLAAAASRQETPRSGNGNNVKGDHAKIGLSGGMNDGGDFEGSTWWLDVQSPTDEEMKMLSKVSESFLTMFCNI